MKILDCGCDIDEETKHIYACPKHFDKLNKALLIEIEWENRTK